ncbi:hypothetical protein [Levilactobacillus bambusae]|uniref:Uncharacterized protein n=1 Tax=Levilactobacillus bambusae TaxID=2024736 RepID=A0A2V1N0H5_9LACO|nr:hypothetical protein [Levilactobacillus bambusae]PWG00749.1 hypothetical protein DCM90_00810 [Levilactobacillus bambusae]
MLSRTKQFLKQNHYRYEKSYIRPLMTPESVYVFKFGRDSLNNRVIIRYTHTWTGRQRINEIDLRLHKQKHPRVFQSEADMLDYLESHLVEHDEQLSKMKQADDSSESEKN